MFSTSIYALLFFFETAIERVARLDYLRLLTVMSQTFNHLLLHNLKLSLRLSKLII